MTYFILIKQSLEKLRRGKRIYQWQEYKKTENMVPPFVNSKVFRYISGS